MRRGRALGVALAAALLAVVTPALDARAAAGLVDEVTDGNGVVRQTHAYGTEGSLQTLDVYLPPTQAGSPVLPGAAGPRRPALVFVHGGSWAIGDKSEWAKEAAEIARRGWVGVSLNYRMTDTAAWPAQRDDVSAALAYLQRVGPSLGVDVERIGALGDSAGGHLAALLGVARPGQAPVRAVVTLSGVNDLPGVLQQPSSGGCTTPGCTPKHLAGRVATDLMRCLPATCAAAYREASPGALVTAASPATIGFNSEGELIDPRQAWVMDVALRTKGRASRVEVVAGKLHARGYQSQVFERALRFLAATLLPETAPPYPRPTVTTTLDLPAQKAVALRAPVRMRGVVRPRAYGSSVALQVRTGSGAWRTVRSTPLQRGTYDTYYDTTWTPSTRGTFAWRAVWTGGGGVGTSRTSTLTVR